MGIGSAVEFSFTPLALCFGLFAHLCIYSVIIIIIMRLGFWQLAIVNNREHFDDMMVCTFLNHAWMHDHEILLL
jgi:hypothetical protein